MPLFLFIITIRNIFIDKTREYRMKSIKLVLIMAFFAATSICALEKSATPENDAEILQIQNTLQELGREHLAAQKHIGATASTTIQNKITELKNQLNSVLTPEQRAQIKAKIEQLKLNIKQYIKPSTTPAA